MFLMLMVYVYLNKSNVVGETTGIVLAVFEVDFSTPRTGVTLESVYKKKMVKVETVKGKILDIGWPRGAQEPKVGNNIFLFIKQYSISKKVVYSVDKSMLTWNSKN